MDLSDVEYVDAEFHQTIYPRCAPALGDVLLTKDGANTGNVTLNSLGEPFSLLSSVCLLKVDDRSILSRYLMYYLQSSDGFEQMTGQMTGTAIKRIILKTIKDTVVPVAPLAEQRRIVGVLDEALAGLETLRANAEKNLQNARALLESYLDSLFATPGSSWKEKVLAEVVSADCSLSYGIVQPGKDITDGLPIVRPTDLTTKVIYLEGLKRIDPDLAVSYRRTTLQGGELLLCVRGTTGVVGVAAAELAGANVTRGIVPIRFRPREIEPSFGYWVMISPPIQKQIAEKTYGAALMQINIGDLRRIMLSFPDVTRQKEIADGLDALSTETQRLAAVYQRKLDALDELKKSLLHEAFSGKL